MGEIDYCSAALPDGSRVAYTVTGSKGKPIVLLHGGTGTRRDWERAASMLSERHVVVAVDMIGFGDSDRPRGRYTCGRLADSVICAMDQLAIDRAHLVGHSLGGRVALDVARSHPERTGCLVMIAPMGFGRLSVPGFMLGLAHWAAHRLTLTPLPYPDLEIEIDDSGLRSPASIAADTKFIWGGGDMFFPSRYADRVLSAIPSASAEIFESAGHSPHLEFPERFSDCLLDFVAGR